MKHTGIVRRVDELGRIVVPKEMRRVLYIKEGDEVEIINNENLELIIRKYSSMMNIKEDLKTFTKAVCEGIGGTVLISDRFEFVAASGGEAKSYEGKRITNSVYEVIVKKEELISDGAGILRVTIDDPLGYEKQIIFPIQKGAEAYGAIIFLGKDVTNLDVAKAVMSFAANVVSNLV